MPNLPRITSGNIITACVVLVTVSVAWGTLNTRVSTNERELRDGRVVDKELADTVVDLRLAFERFTSAVERIERLGEEIVRSNNRRAFPPLPAFAGATVDESDYPLTLTVLASEVGRHPDTIVRWMSEGKVDVPTRKTPAGEYRFSESDLALMREYASRLTQHGGTD